jgi:hypothetical protein
LETFRWGGEFFNQNKKHKPTEVIIPTPKRGYYTTSGVRVPGTTTIIGRFKESGGLIHWANQLAYEPYRACRAQIEKIVQQGAVDPGTIADCWALLQKPADACDYRTARDTAAGVGTIVHARIDAYIRGKKLDISELPEDFVGDPMAESQQGFDAFLQWAGSTSFQLVEGEMQLVSDNHKFGGTPDVVFVRGAKCVGDWKTGDLYPVQVLPQLAAYENLLIEHDKLKGGAGGHAISINKKTGGFTHRYFTPEEMAIGWKVFIAMRELYELLKEIK